MALWLCGWVGRGVWGPGDTLVLGRARLKLSPHSEDMLPPWATPGLQAEIANIQKEKERIATTTIDDELAADPELAKVRPAVVVVGGGRSWWCVMLAQSLLLPTPLMIMCMASWCRFPLP